MNLKFTDDINNTFITMKSGLYFLGYLAGIHTVTFVCYLAYKHFTVAKTDLDKKTVTDDVVDTNLPPTSEPVLQMESVVDSENNDAKIKQQIYDNLMSKRTELIDLIKHLDDIQDNITSFRDKLQQLST